MVLFDIIQKSRSGVVLAIKNDRKKKKSVKDSGEDHRFEEDAMECQAYPPSSSPFAMPLD